MQEHLIQILGKYSMRKDVINRLLIDVDTHIFREDVEEEDKWVYYNWVCRELKIKDKIIRSHGMDTKKAHEKKIKGHNDENFFEQFGFQVQSGTNKTDLTKDGKSFGSVKGGVKIQWGMHVFSKLPHRLQKLFGDWISTYEKNSLYFNKRKDFASDIIEKLNNKDERYYLLNYFLRKNEEVPFLIVKDVDVGTYYRIKYEDLIKVLVDNIEFYSTNDKVKIVARIKLDEKDKVVFEFEPRTDKNNALLMHGLSKVIINIINNYKINVEETY